MAISTVCGVGLLPLAPGTFGALAAIPVVYLTTDLHWLLRSLFWSLVIIMGTWAAKVFDQLMDSHDNQNIVIDEAVGIAITAWTAGGHLQTLAVAFVIFRFFDIVKLPPVRQVDAMSIKISKDADKNILGFISPEWRTAMTVMADDIIAGFQGLFIVLVLQKLGFLP
ncbi:MAG: phosphatidylglycerophosphatase A [Bdellovibrionota bacterium]